MQQSLNSGSAQVQILLAVRQIHHYHDHHHHRHQRYSRVLIREFTTCKMIILSTFVTDLVSPSWLSYLQYEVIAKLEELATILFKLQ